MDEVVNYLTGNLEAKFSYFIPLIFDFIKDFNPFKKPQKMASPIILDLAGNGIKTLNTADGTYFDLDANGFAERTGWVTSSEGLLCLDRNNDGSINDGSELFGDHTF